MQEIMAADRDEYFMALAIKEAKKGLGRTSPNPCVGAVIVKNDQIIASGWHQRAGEPHAEINALRQAGELALGAEMYVTLEPCHHTGKTPPCSRAVAEAGIRRVVVGMVDPNLLVNGSGISFLQGQGIAVETGVLEEECIAINRPFIKRITTGMPLVSMKVGMSLDGRITYQQQNSGWITGKESLGQVHRLRNEFDAIMVGSGTVMADNPSLTTRGVINGRDPQRIIVDSNLSISPGSKIFELSSTAETIIFCHQGADKKKAKLLEEAGVLICRIKADGQGRVSLPDLLIHAAEMGINSILLEGGARLNGSMLVAGLVDEAYLFMAPIFIGDHGLPLFSGFAASSKADCIRLEGISRQRLGEDVLLHGLVKYP